MKGFTIESPASVEYDMTSGKLVIPTTNDDPGAAHKQLKVNVHLFIVIRFLYSYVWLIKLIK